jgi:hypothetical protein
MGRKTFEKRFTVVSLGLEYEKCLSAKKRISLMKPCKKLGELVIVEVFCTSGLCLVGCAGQGETVAKGGIEGKVNEN